MRLAKTVEILGVTYAEVKGADAALWPGDLIQTDAPLGADARVLMVSACQDFRSLYLVNFVGHKAGLPFGAPIPAAAASQGALNIRVAWIMENWRNTVGVGQFETATLLTHVPKET